jgi:hypothetical protein
LSTGSRPGQGVPQGPREDLAQVRGVRAEGEGKDRQRHGRLRQGRHRHLAARAHAAERRSRVEPGQRESERSEQEEVDHDEQVTGRVKRQGYREQRQEERDGDRGDEHHEGRDMEDPRGVLGDDDLFGEELPQLQVRLPDRGPAPALEPRFHPADKTHEAGRERERQDDLSDFQHVSRHRGHRAARSRTRSASVMYAR